MGNFIDKTFTVIADILLKILPASKQEKQAFSYYRAGMSAQGKGRYAEALKRGHMIFHRGTPSTKKGKGHSHSFAKPCSQGSPCCTRQGIPFY